jgi:hypothetical protein
MAETGNTRWNGNYGSAESQRRKSYDFSTPDTGKAAYVSREVRKPESPVSTSISGAYSKGYPDFEGRVTARKRF